MQSSQSATTPRILTLEAGYTSLTHGDSRRMAKIDIYKYTHLDKPDVKASIVKISVKSKKMKELSKLNEFVVGQFYSEKRQALTDINQGNLLKGN